MLEHAYAVARLNSRADDAAQALTGRLEAPGPWRVAEWAAAGEVNVTYVYHTTWLAIRRKEGTWACSDPPPR